MTHTPSQYATAPQLSLDKTVITPGETVHVIVTLNAYAISNAILDVPLPPGWSYVSDSGTAACVVGSCNSVDPVTVYNGAVNSGYVFGVAPDPGELQFEMQFSLTSPSGALPGDSWGFISTASFYATDQWVTTSNQVSVRTQAGNARIDLTTADGGPIPTGTTVCLDAECHLVNEIAPAEVASGSTAVFDNIVPGAHTVAITGDDPYLPATAPITIVDGETVTAAITLLLPVPIATSTPPPTATAIATATATGTPPPTSTTTPTPVTTPNPSFGYVFPKTPTVTPPTSPGARHAGSVAISALPNTGTGARQDGWLVAVAMLAGTMLLVLGIIGGLRRDRRHRR
jgi:hypothetical protein